MSRATSDVISSTDELYSGSTCVDQRKAANRNRLWLVKPHQSVCMDFGTEVLPPAQGCIETSLLNIQSRSRCKRLNYGMTIQQPNFEAPTCLSVSTVEAWLNWNASRVVLQ